MLNYYKNELIDSCLQRFYQSFRGTLDTSDYVPKKYHDYIVRYIFKSMKKQFKVINRENRREQKAIRREEKKERREQKRNNSVEKTD